MQPYTAMRFSGISWLLIGSVLIYRAMRWFIASTMPEEGVEKAFFLKIGDWKGVSLLCIVGICLGWAKGRLIFRKTVDRVVRRILQLPSPFPIRKMYAPGYLALMIGMSGFGMCFRFFPLPPDIKGFLDLTIGVALCVGSGFYFRCVKTS